MLTHEDIKGIRLKRAVIGGYKAEEVNNFIDDVVESMRKLEKENSELLSKIKELLQKNSRYKEEQESIRVTLVKAQKLADSSIEEAKNQAELILANAKFDADRIIADAKLQANKTMEELKNEAAVQTDVLNDLKRSVKDFRSNILNLYKDHIKLVNSLTSEDKAVERNIKSEEGPSTDVNVEKKVEEEQHSEQYIKVVEKENSTEEKKSVNKKFINLKFGENYDVSKDVEEQAVGLFSKIQ